MTPETTAISNDITDYEITSRREGTGLSLNQPENILSDGSHGILLVPRGASERINSSVRQYNERSETPGDAQRRLDTVADGKGQENARAVDATEQPTDESPGEREQRANQASSAQSEVRDHVQQAPAALQTLDEAL